MRNADSIPENARSPGTHGIKAVLGELRYKCLNTNRRTVVRTLGIISITGCILTPVTDIAGILLRNDYNALTDSVSILATGSWSWIQSIGMYCTSFAIMSCALGLFMAVGGPTVAVVGKSLLLVDSIPTLFTAIFKTTPTGAEKDFCGQLHAYSGVAAAILLLPVYFLIAPAFRKRKKLFIYTIVTGVLGVIFEVGRGRLPANWALFGLHERLIGLNSLLWIAIISWVVLFRYQPETGRRHTTP